MRYQTALRPDRKGACSANGSGAASRLAGLAATADTGPMTRFPTGGRDAAMGRRVLLFSSVGHALMHLMTAFYAVIVLTLAVAWNLPPEQLLELYAPSAVLLGVASLPAGWVSYSSGRPLL